MNSEMHPEPHEDGGPWRPSRRRLLQAGGLGAAAAVAGGGIYTAIAGGGPSTPAAGASRGIERPQSPPPPLPAGMVTRTIPGSDIALPAIGLGTFQTFDALPEQARSVRDDVLRRFWASGGRVVDTSPLYGLAEANIARSAVADGIQNDLFVTNKIWSTGNHLGDASHAEASLDTSMRRLSRTAPIDVMQCHATGQRRHDHAAAARVEG